MTNDFETLETAVKRALPPYSGKVCDFKALVLIVDYRGNAHLLSDKPYRFTYEDYGYFSFTLSDIASVTIEYSDDDGYLITVDGSVTN